MKNPHHQRALQNALKKLQSGKADAATKAALAALKKFPKDVELLKLAGVAATQAGAHASAAKSYMELLKLTPQAMDVKVSLGLALVHAGRSDIARQRVTEWRADTPERAELHYLSAAIAIDGADFDLAIQDATKALEHAPAMERAFAIRALARFEKKEFKDALVDFESANALAPNTPETMSNIGLCHQELHDHDNAIKAFEACIVLNTSDVIATEQLAIALEQKGDFEQAKARYHDVLKLQPDNWAAINQLVELTSEQDRPALEAHVNTALRSAKRNTQDEVLGTLALANLLNAKGDWAKAAPVYQRSNDLQAKLSPYESAKIDAQLGKTLSAFAQPYVLRTGGDTQSPTPVFVIGQPRSGTTLTEMVISAHPDVVGLGEVEIETFIDQSALAKTPASPADLARIYRSEMPHPATGYRSFVDKMPSHYLFVGFLAEAFPTAKFVHVQRDPREVAVSMWKRHFLGGSAYNYASRMDWMAHAANTYQRYMVHWSMVFPDRILHIHYRDLVQDIESTSKALADFCDLTWDAAMMHPEQNTTQVRTSSITQVRKAPHKNSLGVWDKHGDLLEPFIAALDRTLWPDI